MRPNKLNYSRDVYFMLILQIWQEKIVISVSFQLLKKLVSKLRLNVKHDSQILQILCL